MKPDDEQISHCLFVNVGVQDGQERGKRSLPTACRDDRRGERCLPNARRDAEDATMNFRCLTLLYASHPFLVMRAVYLFLEGSALIEAKRSRFENGSRGRDAVKRKCEEDENPIGWHVRNTFPQARVVTSTCSRFCFASLTINSKRAAISS